MLMTFEEINLASVVRPLWALLAGVTVLLFIACTNVGNLLLVRGTTRLPELAIRTAIGASHARIVRQGITEGLVLAAMGGAAGVALGTIGLRAGLALVPADIARLDQVRLDRTVLAFTVSIVIVTGASSGWLHAGRRALAAQRAGVSHNPWNRRYRGRPSPEAVADRPRGRAGDAPARRGRAAGVGVP